MNKYKRGKGRQRDGLWGTCLRGRQVEMGEVESQSWLSISGVYLHCLSVFTGL